MLNRRGPSPTAFFFLMTITSTLDAIQGLKFGHTKEGDASWSGFCCGNIAKVTVLNVTQEVRGFIFVRPM